MSKSSPKISPPICCVCKSGARVRLTDGAEIYPHRPDLAEKSIWKCDGCTGYVGCHPGTNKPLGTPADEATRNARMQLHNKRVDPLWHWADRCGLYTPENISARRRIRRSARYRVYAFLADRLGLTVDNCHIGMFDLDTCRRAWIALNGMDYPKIREWAFVEEKAKGKAA